MIKIDLTGRVAIVTGGSRGIGAGISQVLSKAGAKVVLTHTLSKESGKTALALVKKIEAQGGTAVEMAAEVQDFKQMQKATSSTIKQFGAIDILVTCAGITSLFPVEKLELGEWERILKVDLTGTFNSIKAVLPYMLKQNKGVILSIGSAAIVAGTGGGIHYASSKAALEGLNRGLTKELAPKGIRSNLIHPSLIDTDLLHERHPELETREKLAKAVPVGRLGRPEDIAYIVAFLASDLASYITGQSFFIDGGRTFCK